MGELVNLNSLNQDCANESREIDRIDMDLTEIADGILYDIHTNVPNSKFISVPIAQLATLGAGVSFLIPALRTVTQTTSINTQGLYRLENASTKDVLKVAKNGNFWGAFKTAEGKSKLAQLQAVDSLSATNTAVMPIDPATMMMAVALFSIEKQLGNIAEMEKQILTFLEVEKEAEIEADVETLSNIILKYKFNWDNNHFTTSNHKLVLDIQRTARKNMISYQKKVRDVLYSKNLIVSQSKVTATFKDLLKKFKYYRLSLYTFSMASLIEIMLSGDFKEENVICIKKEIETLSMSYRDIYGECSLHLERLSDSSLETNVLKSIGVASKTVGKIIGDIPVIRDGPIDEFLRDRGIQLKENAVGIEKKVVESFAEISNPGNGVFIRELENMIQIYGHTTDICFDEKNIYLITA